MAALVLANGPNVFNVLDYGADPNHFFDSTAAFQAAFCAAILAKGGTVYIPPGEYIVKSTIKVYCLDQFGVNVIGASGSGVSGSPVGSTIDYQGPDGTACFAIQGMNYSYWRGFGVNLGGNGTAANQIAFDLQVGQNNVPVLNQGNNLMECIVVNMQGTGGGHIGIRLGQYNDNTPPYGDQGSNISGTTLLQFTINGDYQGPGHAPSTSIGVQFGGGQVKPNRVMFCAVGGLGCDYLVGSIGSLLLPPQGGTGGATVSTSQTYLPVNDVTLFKRNGSNPLQPRYVIIGLQEICSYTGVTNQVPIPAAPSLSLISGTSTVAAVYVVITYVDRINTTFGLGGTLGETIRSSESSELNIPGTQQVQVASPAPAGDATAYNVYVGTVSGGPYYLQNTNPIAIGTPFTIPDPPLSPPSSTTQPGPSLTNVPGASTVSPVYIVLTYVDQYGETTGSSEFKMIPTLNEQQVQVSVPTAFGDATEYNVYVGTASGGPYYLQNTGSPIKTGTDFFLIPATPYSPSTQPPSTTQPPLVNTTSGWTGTLTGVTRGVLNTTPAVWHASSTVIEYQPNVGVYGVYCSSRNRNLPS